MCHSVRLTHDDVRRRVGLPSTRRASFLRRTMHAAVPVLVGGTSGESIAGERSGLLHASCDEAWAGKLFIGG